MCRRLLAPLATSVWFGIALLCLAASAEEGSKSRSPDFAREVLPVLEARCAECHGSHLRRPKARLLLTREGLLRGGVDGPALVPGDAEASLLVQGIRHTHDWLEMPPDGKLPSVEVELLARWVDAGAEWPEGLEAVWRAPEETDGERPRDDSAARPRFAPDDLAFFERSVRPLLAAECFDCHGPDVPRPKSEFRMDGHGTLLRGGASGAAVVPGDPDASRLIRAVRYEGEPKMPPFGKLEDPQIAVLEEWVARGAPWPPTDRVVDELEEEDHLDIERGRERWAFSTPKRVLPPRVEGADTPVDAFVLARLRDAGLQLAPQASARELYRRLSFDLLGLPPDVEELRAFEARYAADPEEAFDEALDDMLARPAYGERWARHWLDVVRFAQTNGFERDAEKPFAWRYRDWVVDALNADLPYDEFLRYQLAGDEIEDAGADGLIATGFYRLGTWDDEPADPVEAEFDELDDVLRTISEGMMGVTIGCARCHDHRFDPFPQEDYYSMQAFVRGVQRYEKPEFSFRSATLRPLDESPQAIERWRAEQAAAKRVLQEELQEIRAQARSAALEAQAAELGGDVLAAFENPAAERSPADLALLHEHLTRPSAEQVKAALTPEQRLRSRAIATELEAGGTSTPGSLRWALTVREGQAQPPDTHLLLRGRAASPGPVVEPRFPAALVASDAAATPPPPRARADSSGRRSVLAEWITDPRHPLTARVIVNRVWHHHFGRGIVATPNDFGSTGIPPTHPDLLDWLAADFVEHGWSLKRLHRTLLRTRVWRQTSRVAPAAALAADPGNDLLWRQRPRRLEAEAIRDALFAVSDSLDRERGGRGFFPSLSREALAGMSKPGLGWEPSDPGQRARRTLYAFAMRGLAVPLLQQFDAPSATLPVGARATTTLATQALTLLNSEIAGRAALALARRVHAEAGGAPEAQVERAFERALTRSPQPDERRLALEFLASQRAAFAQRPQESLFEPAVPERLEVRYHARLSGADMLRGPRERWSYHGGVWGGSYNGTLEWDDRRGPFALAEGPLSAAPLRLGGELVLEPGTWMALLLGADADGDAAVVLELDAGERSARLLRSEPRGRAEVLSECAGAFEPGEPFALSLSASDGAIAVELRGTCQLRAHVPGAPWAGGQLGLRVRGEAVRLRGLALEQGGRRRTFDDRPLPVELRALASLCLVLLNHNEFVHVD